MYDVRTVYIIEVICEFFQQKEELEDPRVVDPKARTIAGHEGEI
jgi:hypothetical protein